MATSLYKSIEAIEGLKEALSEESCLKREPFMKIGSGAAPTLNYNIPQNSCFRTFSTSPMVAGLPAAFCNGYSESLRIVEVEELENLLEDVVKPENIATVREKLLKPYCSVWNYEDDPIDFIETVEVDYGTCIGTPSSETFWRIKKGVEDTYTAGGLEIRVPGPILNVSTHTLKTSSVVADAILGQGEALDCYNMKLQDASAVAEQLKNLSTVQQIALIEEITDPTQRAELYKRVFGNCCDVAQNIIGGCGCAEKTPEA